MKKTLQLLVTAFLAFILIGCNIQTVEQFEKMEEQERSVDKPTTDEGQDKSQAEESSAEPVKPDNVQEEQPQVEQQAEEKLKEDSKEVTEKEQAVEQVAATTPTEQVEKKPVTEKPKQPETKPATDNPKQHAPESEKQPEEKQEKKRYVTITIRVDSILKNWDLLDPSLQSEKYVPKNGIILKTTKYELLTEKETVWDVLRRATKEQKIQIEYQGANENIYNSVYVEGINHLYEFSAGPLSGWMYKVNGVYPNYGSSQYILEDGDVIEWHYTVDLGRDLGNEWTGE